MLISNAARHLACRDVMLDQVGNRTQTLIGECTSKIGNRPGVGMKRSLTKRPCVGLLAAEPAVQAAIRRQSDQVGLRLLVSVRETVAAVKQGKVDIAVVSAIGRDGLLLDTLHALRPEHPSLPIVAVIPLRSNAALEILRGAQAGLTDVALLGYDDIGKVLERVVGKGRLGQHADFVWQQLAAFVPDSVKPIVLHCLGNCCDQLSVSQVADHLGIDRKTMNNRLSAVGWPSAKSVIDWSRLLVAGRLFSLEQLTTDEVARTVGLVSSSAFRSVAQRLTGMSPSKLVKLGWPKLLECFHAALAAKSFE